MNAAVAQRPPVFSLLGREWDLLPGVFAPVHDLSTQLFTTWLPYPDQGSFLEIGCGAGVTAVTAALKGCAEVTALDISEEAVENTRLNVRRHGVGERVRVLRSDLFAELEEGARFDAIFWNSSFIELPPDHVVHNVLERAIFDPGYTTHRSFLDQAAHYVRPDGRIFLGFSSLGNHELLKSLARQAGLETRTLRGFPAMQPAVLTYQLLELVRM
ncbi:methyltransferase [Nonomuraea lactucae]|uniref:methyltransferase n=1 Tax=Nonomuraea lactucae TaxID=2249762 RepID=UPI000DE1D9A7|nr:methyltransferase [Nonomuraea lactucae]